MKVPAKLTAPRNFEIHNGRLIWCMGNPSSKDRDLPVPTTSCFCFIIVLSLVPPRSLCLALAPLRPSPQCSGSLCSGCTSTRPYLSLLNHHAPFVSVAPFPCIFGFPSALGQFENIPCKLLHFPFILLPLLRFSFIPFFHFSTLFFSFLFSFLPSHLWANILACGSIHSLSKRPGWHWDLPAPFSIFLWLSSQHLYPG